MLTYANAVIVIGIFSEFDGIVLIVSLNTFEPILQVVFVGYSLCFSIITSVCRSSIIGTGCVWFSSALTTEDNFSPVFEKMSRNKAILPILERDNGVLFDMGVSKFPPWQSKPAL